MDFIYWSAIVFRMRRLLREIVDSVGDWVEVGGWGSSLGLGLGLYFYVFYPIL